MKIVTAARHLIRTTDWNLAGIAFVLGVPVEAIVELAIEDGDRRVADRRSE